MPWDETIIWLTTLNEAGMPTELCQVAGGKDGEQKISAQQPLFSPRENSFLSRTSLAGGTSIDRVVLRVSAQWTQSSGVRTGVLDCTLMIF